MPQILALNQLIEVSWKNLFNFPYEVSTKEALEEKLWDLNTNFQDIDFPPTDESVYEGPMGSPMESPFDTLIHWWRPDEFMKVDYNQGLLEPNVFYQTLEPNDIRMGALGDSWFMCALATLAERPALVEWLFITKEVNSWGIYRVKLCKNGEWVTVTIDDYFPCFPEGGPLFSRSHCNELWVLLLEKAYAKLHGNYNLLWGGYACEGLIDLTGCPCAPFDFTDEFVKMLIDSGEFWKLIV